ncbi:tetratricopeptide repeat protein [Sphingomonas cynarae]|uniref:Ancillary SecYEG translocon subunit n=1 Tax=Sphingomonas cynarae TaxID=930197 RepID=A0ABP7CYR8_9SPHN
MALPPNANAEVFMREVDEEVRRDRMTQFWTRWGKVAIAAIVLALAVLAGVLYWQHRSREAAGAEGERLQAAYDALGQGRIDKAQPALAELAASDRDVYRALARFTEADIVLQRNDLKAAAAKFAEVAADTGQAQPIRDLALIRQTAAEFDTLKPQVVVERMRPLAVPGGAWLGSAGEMMAVAQLRLGQKAQAGQLFARIARDEGVPGSIRQRAVQMAGLLGVDAVPAAPAATQEAAR